MNVEFKLIINEKKTHQKKKNTSYLIGLFIFLIFASLMTGVFTIVKRQKQVNYNKQVFSSCENLQKKLDSNSISNLNIKDKGTLQSKSFLQGTVTNSTAEKYKFTPQQNRKLDYQTSNPVKVCVYNEQNKSLQNNQLYASQKYSIFIITTQKREQKYELQFTPKIIEKEIASKPNQNSSDQNISNSINPKQDHTQKNNSFPQNSINNGVIREPITYSVKHSPDLKTNQKLQSIIDDLVTICMADEMPIGDISITLINVNKKTVAQYQGNTLRYPASVAKLFWLVILYSYVEEGIIDLDPKLSNLVNKMMAKSDNEAASKIIDEITQTKSGYVKSKKQFKRWYQKRWQLNNFFRVANYSQLNITQKTFPIPYLDQYGKRPKGLDLKMRHLRDRNKKNPIRNKLTTWHASRLMYEIITNKAVSPKYSEKIQNHLERDLNPQAWKHIDPRFEFNPVQAFFGEGLPTNIRFLSKAGWTSSTRQEVAYIETPNEKTRYILAIFAEDKAYAENWDIFPKLSKSVFQQMTQSTTN